MNIIRTDMKWQYIMLLLISLWPCGFYFCFDAPAALAKFFKAGLDLSSTEYMLYYSWYSAPAIAICIVGGVLVDNVFGRRKAGIIFLIVVLVGQGLFTFSVQNNYMYTGLVGRSLIGIGSETTAVVANCYLCWWYNGTPLQPLAFGLSLSVWRMSSSLSLLVSTPYYNSINNVEPRDGGGDFFTTCKFCDKGEKDKEGNTVPNKIEMFGGQKFSNQSTYYCYNRNVIDGCQISDLEHVGLWNHQKYNEACQDFNNVTKDFIEKSAIVTYKCFNKADFKIDQQQCDCLDHYKRRSDEWSWFDSKYPLYKDKLLAKNSEYTLEKIAPLRDPFYWLSSFGEFCSGKDLDFKLDLFRDTNYIDCVQYNIPEDFKRATNETSTVWSVASFVEGIKQPALYSPDKKCNEKTSYLTEIPPEDTVARLASLSKVYWTMVVIIIAAGFVYLLIMYLDLHAENTDLEHKKANNLPLPPPSEPFSLKDYVDVVKSLDLNIWICFAMCILFYIAVFTFVSQAPIFFEKYVEVPASAAPGIVGLIYVVSIPLNPVIGAIMGKLKHENIILASAYVLAGCAHLVMTVFKGAFVGLVGILMLGMSYSLVGCTIWPLVGNICYKKFHGRVFGLMFASQQAGLAIVAVVAGKIVDLLGWGALQTFFISCCAVGAFLGFVIITRLGKHLPAALGDEPEREINVSDEEASPLKADI